MRTFAQKQNQPRRPVSSSLARLHTAAPGLDHREHPILHSQRTTGNQVLLTMMQTDATEHEVGLTGMASPRFGHDLSRIPLYPPAAGAIQTKLAINKLGDEYEQEADRVSEQVMRISELQPQRACACRGGCPSCQAEQPSQGHECLRTKRVQSSDLGQSTAPPIVHEVLAASGQPLDPATRGFMESCFGHDFSRVRVHSNQLAARSAEAVAAQAYTVGSNMVFGSGRYAPASRDGQRLLAHELTHVVQQDMSPASAAAVQRHPQPAPKPAQGKTSQVDQAKTLAWIKDVDLGVFHRPKVSWKRVTINSIELIQYGAIAGADNFIGIKGSARVLPGPGKLQFGFVQACLPVLTDHVEWQDASNQTTFQRDSTKVMQNLLPRLDANATVDPWYIDPPIAPDNAGRVEVVMSDNPTGGDTIFCLPVAPSATISEVCWARTFVTAFVVQLPDGTRHPLKSVWWQLHFWATITPKGADPLGVERGFIGGREPCRGWGHRPGLRSGARGTILQVGHFHSCED